MHRILTRQVQKYIGEGPIPLEWQALLNAVSDTYDHFDEDRELLDRSLSLSSKEFLANSQKLQEAKQIVEETVKERTRELRNEQARLLASIQSLTLGFAIFDRSGQVLHANPLFSSLLELSDPHSINELQNLTIQSKQEQTIQKVFELSINNGKPFDLKVFIDKKILRIFISPIVLEPETIGAVMVIEDATKEEQIDRAKSEFVVIASHQLRTPLTIVKWWVQALRQKIKNDPAMEVAGKFLDRIEDGTSRMVALVQALLDVSRIEVGKLAIKPELIDVREVFHSVVQELESDFQHKSLALHEEYAPNIKMIKIDRNLLKIIIQNLLTNAIKYTPANGSIIMRVVQPTQSDLPPTLQPASEYCLVSVSDTGLGIPLTQQSRIFGKLFRADNVKLTKTTGTGLGLYITKSVVEACGGKIWFKSSGENQTSDSKTIVTTFFVALPIKGVGQKDGVVLASTAQEGNELLYS